MILPGKGTDAVTCVQSQVVNMGKQNKKKVESRSKMASHKTSKTSETQFVVFLRHPKMYFLKEYCFQEII